MYASSKVNLWLPKFETRFHIQLNDILCNLGMPGAFQEGADLKKMSALADCLDFVQQDAVIKVDEKGSEAAAVTSAGVLGATAVMPNRVIQFHCDRPFIYLITEAATGSILFAGEFTGE
jgi:serpin B